MAFKKSRTSLALYALTAYYLASNAWRAARRVRVQVKSRFFEVTSFPKSKLYLKSKLERAEAEARKEMEADAEAETKLSAKE